MEVVKKISLEEKEKNELYRMCLDEGIRFYEGNLKVSGRSIETLTPAIAAKYIDFKTFERIWNTDDYKSLLIKEEIGKEGDTAKDAYNSMFNYSMLNSVEKQKAFEKQAFYHGVLIFDNAIKCLERHPETAKIFFEEGKIKPAEFAKASALMAMTGMRPFIEIVKKYREKWGEHLKEAEEIANKQREIYGYVKFKQDVVVRVVERVEEEVKKGVAPAVKPEVPKVEEKPKEAKPFEEKKPVEVKPAEPEEEKKVEVKPGVPTVEKKPEKEIASEKVEKIPTEVKEKDLTKAEKPRGIGFGLGTTTGGMPFGELFFGLHDAYERQRLGLGLTYSFEKKWGLTLGTKAFDLYAQYEKEKKAFEEGHFLFKFSNMFKAGVEYAEKKFIPKVFLDLWRGFGVFVGPGWRCTWNYRQPLMNIAFNGVGEVIKTKGKCLLSPKFYYQKFVKEPIKGVWEGMLDFFHIKPKLSENERIRKFSEEELNRVIFGVKPTLSEKERTKVFSEKEIKELYGKMEKGELKERKELEKLIQYENLPPDLKTGIGFILLSRRIADGELSRRDLEKFIQYEYIPPELKGMMRGMLDDMKLRNATGFHITWKDPYGKRHWFISNEKIAKIEIEYSINKAIKENEEILSKEVGEEELIKLIENIGYLKTKTEKDVPHALTSTLQQKIIKHVEETTPIINSLIEKRDLSDKVIRLNGFIRDSTEKLESLDPESFAEVYVRAIQLEGILKTLPEELELRREVKNNLQGFYEKLGSEVGSKIIKNNLEYYLGYLKNLENKTKEEYKYRTIHEIATDLIRRDLVRWGLEIKNDAEWEQLKNIISSHVHGTENIIKEGDPLFNYDLGLLTNYGFEVKRKEKEVIIR